MNKNKIILIFIFTLLSNLFISCSSVEIIEQKSEKLEQFWDDTDCEISADSLVNNFIISDDIKNFNFKRKPRIVVGRFENITKEDINTDLIEKNIERSLINSGEVTFISSKPKREEIRANRKNHKDFAGSKDFQKYISSLKTDFFVDGKIELEIDSLQVPSKKEYNLFFNIITSKNIKSVISKNIKVVK